MTDVRTIQEEVASWSEENFGDQPAINPLLGVGEEYGELIHSVLKQRQGIRLNEDGVGREAEMDAVGDIVIYLMDFCARRGLDFADCVELAWYGEVRDREWDSTYAEAGDAVEA